MPSAVRATTTTNAFGLRQRRVLPTPKRSNELDPEYLRVLKLIEQTHRQHSSTPSSMTKLPRKSDGTKQKNPKYFYDLSSSLTSIGQEAMVKSYEDKLISHLGNIYSSKPIKAALPRLPTALFRHRLPKINTSNRNNVANIHRAQSILDNIINKDFQKDEILCDYVRWQDQWTKNFV